jgi:hypothetical protein
MIFFFLGNGDFLKRLLLIISMLFWLYIHYQLSKYNLYTNFYAEIIGQIKMKMRPFIYHAREVYEVQFYLRRLQVYEIECIIFYKILGRN